MVVSNRKKMQLMGNTVQHITEVCYFPVEIAIKAAGEKTEITKATPLLYDKVEGVTVVHPGGRHGKGTLQLGVAGEEIFPKGFHARAYMFMNSSHHQDETINREPNRYMYPFKERAKGSTITAIYTEPPGGDSGVLYLVFKLTRQQPCR
jgi:hypothetical protein